MNVRSYHVDHGSHDDHHSLDGYELLLVYHVSVLAGHQAAALFEQTHDFTPQRAFAQSTLDDLADSRQRSGHPFPIAV